MNCCHAQLILIEPDHCLQSSVLRQVILQRNQIQIYLLYIGYRIICFIIQFRSHTCKITLSNIFLRYYFIGAKPAFPNPVMVPCIKIMS